MPILTMCIYAALLSFEAHAPHPIHEQSLGYQIKWSKRQLGLRVGECLLIHRDAKRAKVNFHWGLATAITESGLDPGKVSSKGARSSMQTYKRYVCKGCTLRLGGLKAAERLRTKHGLCDGAAKYNAGPKGSCEGIGSRYASRLIETYLRLLEYEIESL